MTSYCTWSHLDVIFDKGNSIILENFEYLILLTSNSLHVSKFVPLFLQLWQIVVSQAWYQHKEVKFVIVFTQ